MDIATSSAVPAYTGMTWLDEDSIKPDDSITVYLQFSPMRRTYQELPVPHSHYTAFQHRNGKGLRYIIIRSHIKALRNINAMVSSSSTSKIFNIILNSLSSVQIQILIDFSILYDK